MSARDEYEILRGLLAARWRPVILERDGRRCVSCGVAEDREPLDLAHMLPVKFHWRNFGIEGVAWSFSHENLVMLCRLCHREHDAPRGYFDKPPRVVRRVEKYLKSIPPGLPGPDQSTTPPVVGRRRRVCITTTMPKELAEILATNPKLRGLPARAMDDLLIRLKQEAAGC